MNTIEDTKVDFRPMVDDLLSDTGNVWYRSDESDVDEGYPTSLEEALEQWPIERKMFLQQTLEARLSLTLQPFMDYIVNPAPIQALVPQVMGGNFATLSEYHGRVAHMLSEAYDTSWRFNEDVHPPVTVISGNVEWLWYKGTQILSKGQSVDHDSATRHLVINPFGITMVARAG